MSNKAISETEKLLERVELTEKRHGTKSAEYFRAVREFQGLLGKLLNLQAA